MGILSVAGLCALAFVLALCLGTLLGTYSERLAWKTRANTTVAHHCDGTFYYVHTEGYFNENYTLKPFPKEDFWFPRLPK